MADWQAIKTEYITTATSYRKLAKKYGVSHVQIANVGGKEGWVEQRKQYLSETLSKTLTKSSDKEAARLSNLMATTTKAIDVAAKAFEDEQQFNRYLVETGPKDNRETEERIFAKVDTRALKDLTAVLKDLTTLVRDFYNIPTPAQAEARRIAAERLALDQRKSAFGSEDDDDETGVIILPPVLVDGDTDE